MKKNLTIRLSFLLLSLLLLYGCRKEVKSSIFLKESFALNRSSSGNSHQTGCRLVYLDWGDGTSWHFHYNDTGLADKWVLDFGDGLPHDFTLEYDDHERLIKAFDHYNNTIYTYLFTYDGDQLIRQTWSNNITSDGGEIVNTYNNKGEMIRRDDNINDIHAVFVRDHVGDVLHLDFYIGKELYVTGDFTFNKPNRNPLSTVNGLDVGFFFYNYGLWDKRWETSDRYALYNGGDPIVLLDFDPSKTVMKFGEQHYLSSISYYEQVSGNTIINNLTYENCPGGGGVMNTESSKGKTAAKNKEKLLRSLFILPGSAKPIKDQIQELKRQYGK